MNMLPLPSKKPRWPPDKMPGLKKEISNCLPTADCFSVKLLVLGVLGGPITHQLQTFGPISQEAFVCHSNWRYHNMFAGGPVIDQAGWFFLPGGWGIDI